MHQKVNFTFLSIRIHLPKFTTVPFLEYALDVHLLFGPVKEFGLFSTTVRGPSGLILYLFRTLGWHSEGWLEGTYMKYFAWQVRSYYCTNIMEANDQVKLVADKAIRTINELVELINSQPTPLTQNLNNDTSSESFPGTASLLSRPSSGAGMLSDCVPVASSAGRSIRNNLAELQQRFPTSRGRLASYSAGVTVLGTTTGRHTGSAQPYLQAHLHSG